jgi:hypothetical protein
MLKYINLLSLLVTTVSYAQVAFEKAIAPGDIAILKTINENFHGISAIEYLPGTGEWYLGSDRGHYFKFTNCRNVQDFTADNMAPEVNTGYYYESIRYDALHKIYYFSEEKEYYTAVYWVRENLKSQPSQLLQIPLPADNKGIEGLAVTPSGALWIAPEAGWKNETDIEKDTIHFLRYKNPTPKTGIPDYERFKFPITRFRAALKSDRPGGISEILAVDETHLLVLERAYYNTSDQVRAFLWNVTVDEQNMELVKGTLAFDFANVDDLCNIEGMCWGDAEKKTLFIMADDNFYNDKKIPGTERYQKPTLRSQMIVLRRK